MGRLPQGVRRLPSGRLELRFTHKKKRYSVSGSDVPELLQRERELIEELANGYTPNKNITVAAYYKEYLKLWQNGVKPATVHLFEVAMKVHVLPVFGAVKIREIEVRQVQSFYEALIDNKGLAVSSAEIVFSQLAKMLKEACREGVRLDNPCDRIHHRKKTKTRATETIHRAMSKEEQKRFEEAVKGSWYEYAIIFMLYSGVRVGEASALTWKDCDFKKETISIQRTTTIDENGKRIVGTTPKTDSGNRVIPMTETLKRALLNQRKRNFSIYGHIGEQVFLSKRGCLLWADRLDYAIKSVIQNKMPDIKVFTCHGLRDTFATRFLESGGNMKTLQVLLGHSSFKMTSDLYSQVLPDTKKTEMQNMENNLKKGEEA